MHCIKRIHLPYLFALLVLSACGGGGGGGSAAPGSFTADATEISFTADINSPAPDAQIISGSITGISSPVYLVVQYTNTAISNVTFARTGETTGQITIFPRSPSELTPGTYTDMVVASACLDTNCSSQVSGSPKNIRVTYEVTDEFDTTTSTLNFEGVFGSSDSVITDTISITGSTSSWEILSNQSWLSFNQTTGNGVAEIQVSADIEGLSIGAHSANIEIRETTTSETLTINVGLNVQQPTLSFSTTPLRLGGTTGLEFEPVQVELSLNTGTNQYPWTASSSTESGDWLTADSSGNVSSTPVLINVDANRTGLTGGNYFDGTLEVTAEVNGVMITNSVPVYLVLPSHDIYVSNNGIAFASMPGLSNVSKTIQVKDNYGLATLVNVVSDSAWLTVPATAVTGSDFTVTADPAGLAVDTVHYATIQITSDDSSIENTETIRVGFWVGSTTPDAQSIIAGSFSRVVNDPIRPYLYVTNGGADISIYNVYTTGLVGTINTVGVQLLDMTTDNEGSVLYVTDWNTKEIYHINMDTQEVTTSWIRSSNTSWMNLAYVRPNGHGVLLINNLHGYDAETGFDISYSNISRTTAFRTNTAITASKDGRTFCGADTSSFFECYSIVYSDASLIKLTINSLGIGPTGYSGQDYAYSIDGSRIYEMEASSSHGVNIYDRDALINIGNREVGVFGCCVEVSSTGEFAGGADNIAKLFDSTGVLISSYVFDGDIEDRQMVFSGDGLRLIVASGASGIGVVTTQ